MIIKSAVRGLRGHPSPDVAEAVASIDEEVDRLNRVVTDVLDFARPIRFELAPADLGEICRAAAQAAQAVSEAVEVACRTRPRPAMPIVTDAERLRAVLRQRAAQRPAGGARARRRRPAGIPVRLKAGSGSAGRWCVEVIDAGAGIAPADLARLFEPFFTTRRGGSGLGLALARNIVEGLGGTIAVKSRVNSGTTVTIDMPAAAEAAEARA